MLKKTRTASIAAFAAAGLMMMGSPALANDGGGDANVGLLNDSQLSVLPIQLCNSDLSVVAIPIDLLSPSAADDCVNAPLTDVNGDGWADSVDGDANVGVLNNTQVSLLPIQLCNSNITVIGIVADVLSPDKVDDCVNAPLTQASNNNR